MARTTALLAACAAGALLAAVAAAPASALTDRWAAWAPVEGSSNSFRTVMTQQSPGFPAATVASDSRAPVQLPAGASTFLGAGTPPGAKYGSSAGNAYLALRPRADTAAAPSTTTYTFDAPTPDTGWAFVLGDIDADAVRVSATDATGAAVPAAEVATWFAGTFNYAGGPDVPSWDPATSTLTGNAAAADTTGPSGWFEPDVRLTSLTMTYTRRAGFPVYQTWFVSRARPIGGTVADVSDTGDCDLGGVTATLLSPSGEVLATTAPASDGSYSFGEYATQAGYLVRLDVPETCAVVGPAERTVSNRGNDGDPASRADFAVRQIVPQPISGTVRDASGPVAGVVITVTAPGGGTRTTTTADDGTYLVDANALGAGYTVSMTVPAGYSAGPDGTVISGVTIASQPVVQQDFTLVALPSVSGVVTGGGQGLGGVQVVLTPATGAPLAVATLGDGSYSLDGVPPGGYTLSVVAPDGWTAPPPRPVTVPPGGLTGQDAELQRPGAIAGTTTRDGAPAGDVEVVIDGPGGPRVVRTDAEGSYYVDQLGPGTYSVTVRAPDGTQVAGQATLQAVVTTAGEIRGGLDFALVTAAAPSPTQSPAPSPTDPPTTTPTSDPTSTPTASEPTAPGPGGPDASPPGGSADIPADDDAGGQVGPGSGQTTLPDTGGPSAWIAAAGATSVTGGLALIVAARRRSPRT